MIVVFWAGAALGQTSSLGVSAASALPGSTAAVTISLTSSPGSEPVAIQWTLTYDPAMVVGISPTVGSAAASAGKTIQCGGAQGGYTCIVTGLNASTIPNGTVAVVALTLSTTAANTVPIGISGVLGVSTASDLIVLTGAGGTISVINASSAGTPPSGGSGTAGTPRSGGSGTASPPPTGTGGTSSPAPAPGSTGGTSSGTAPSGSTAGTVVSALSCTNVLLPAGSTLNCTVSLNQSAPAGGVNVSLMTNSSAIKIPTSVTVPAGEASVTFPIAPDSSAPSSSILLTAALNGSLQRLLISVVNPAVLNNLTVVAVLDAASNTTNVAQGSVFIVKGSNLAPEGLVGAGSYPLPASLNGVSIALTPAGGGSTILAYMIYTFGRGAVSQLAALVPSNLPVGNYNAVVITANGTSSAPVPLAVVPRKFELFTADGSGSGSAAAQTVDPAGIYHFNRFTTLQLGPDPNQIGAPAHPGDFVIVYGTGLGAIAVPDQLAPGPLDFRGQADIQVVVGGRTIAPAYAGRSPNYPGIDQVNFQLPADISTGCIINFQVSVGGQFSNSTTLAIAPAGRDVCSPAPVSNDVLSRLDQGGTLALGTFWLMRLTDTPSPPLPSGLAAVGESAVGAFVKYPGSQLGTALALLANSGSCQVSHTAGNGVQLLFGPLATYLDAGPLALTGPGISNKQFNADPSGTYSLPLGVSPSPAPDSHLPLGLTSFNPSPVLGPGTYQITGGGGGDIGSFTARATIGEAFSVTGGIPASIDRTKDLVLLWSGGNPGDAVSVTGVSGTVIGGTAAAPVYDAARFTCTSRADAGFLIVPSAVLGQLPVTPAGPRNGIGYVTISSGAPSAPGNGTFTAPLTGGGNLDVGSFTSMFGVFATTSFQ